MASIHHEPLRWRCAPSSCYGSGVEEDGWEQLRAHFTNRGAG
ncbi:hypothetical protein [Paenibacillus polymyxa]|nr:hypothetical protein [Paenibacillus polymyxa]